jgi:hypothetical protein
MRMKMMAVTAPARTGEITQDRTTGTMPLTKGKVEVRRYLGGGRRGRGVV